jgi:hypothetical protein
MLCREITSPTVGAVRAPGSGSRLSTHPIAGCATGDTAARGSRTSIALPEGGTPSAGGPLIARPCSIPLQSRGEGAVPAVPSVSDRAARGSCAGWAHAAGAAEAAAGTRSLAGTVCVSWTASTMDQAVGPGSAESSVLTTTRPEIGSGDSPLRSRAGLQRDGSRPGFPVRTEGGWATGGVASAGKVVQEASGAARPCRRADGEGVRSGSIRASATERLTTCTWLPAVPGVASGNSSACR